MRLIHAMALVGLAVLVPIGNPGCSKYGEGAVCDPLNNDPQTNISNDCDDGLQCTPSQCSGTAICCPPPGHTVTSPACSAGALQDCGTGGGNNTGGHMGGGNPGVGGFGGGGAPPMCPHDECVIGEPLIAGYQMKKKDPACSPKGECPSGKTCVDGVCRTPICSQCVNDICDGITLKDGTVIPADPECCGTHAWDMFCVDKVASVCMHLCSMNTGGGGTGGTTLTGSGGSGGAGGAGGATP